MRRLLLFVCFAGAIAAQTSAAGGRNSAPSQPQEVKAAQPGGPIDLNVASEKELEALPGVSKGTAKKIIAGRPYASVNELRKAGVSQRTIDRIRPLVSAKGTDASIAAQAEAAARKDQSANRSARQK